MSYAKAAASSGPIGAEPLPQPPVHPDQHQADAATSTEDVNEFNDAAVDDLKTGVTNDFVKNKENKKEAKKENKETKKDVKDGAEKTKKDVKDGAEKTKKDAKDGAEKAGKAAKNVKEDVKKGAKNTYDDIKHDTKDLRKTAADKAAQAKEGAADLAKDAKNKINKEAQNLPQDAEELKKDAHKLAKSVYAKGKEMARDGQDAVQNFAEEHEDEIKDFEERSKSLWDLVVAHTTRAAHQVADFVACKSQCAGNKAQRAVATTRTELHNPAVLGQLAVAVAAAATGYMTFVERKHRINTGSKTVLGVHASVVTGLILLDAYVFKRAYRKYDKKPDRNL